MLADIIAVAIQRGGAGKTFLTYSLATDAAARGEPTLLVDVDPQVSLTEIFGIDTTTCKGTVDSLLSKAIMSREVEPVEPLVVAPDLALLPGSIDMAVTDSQLATLAFGRESCLKRVLQPYREHFRWILIDCSPSLGMLTINALNAAASLVVPVTTEFVGMRALRKFIGFAYENVKRELNPGLELIGILPNKYDTRRTEDRTVLENIRKEYDGRFHVFEPAKDLAGYSRAVARRIPQRSGDNRNDLDWLQSMWARIQREVQRGNQAA